MSRAGYCDLRRGIGEGQNREKNIMKIVIGYPPTESAKGIPTLGQNRQFQWFSHPCLIYPLVLASAATMVKQAGHVVRWIDAVAERLDRQHFFQLIQNDPPDMMAFESKTPVIRQHWAFVTDIKKHFPAITVVMMGDHVTALPRETMEKADVDYILCGGDFDFLLKDLVDHVAGSAKRLPPGIYYRDNGEILSSGAFALQDRLDTAPFIDRELTKWRLYQQEANMPGKPYFYIMSGRDCWWGRCRFCSWQTLYPGFRTRSVAGVLDEIGWLIQDYGAREIFDDCGTLSTGSWLKNLCRGLRESGYNQKVRYSCNMRFGVLRQHDYDLMKKAGFRLLKFGLESANQATLDRIGKGITVEDIVDGCRMAHNAGLTVHITMIVGYPWETKEDARRTLALAKSLMQKGFADICQATLLVPYPGTPLWREAREKHWFLFDPAEYERYDMSEPVLQTAARDAGEVAKICGKIYGIYLTPTYLFRRIKKISSWQDLAFHLKGARAVRGHLHDFLGRKNSH